MVGKSVFLILNVSSRLIQAKSKIFLHMVTLKTAYPFHLAKMAFIRNSLVSLSNPPMKRLLSSYLRYSLYLCMLQWPVHHLTSSHIAFKNSCV